MILFVIFSLSACTMLPAKKPIEKDKGIKEAPESGKDSPKISVSESLSIQAKKFSSQGNFQDALLIYNQALSKANEVEKLKLISDIELVLAKTPVKIIQEFIVVKIY